MATQQVAVPIIQNSIPVWYSPRVKVIPCSPDRVPQLSVEILYLIAQALPRPKWVYDLARVNKQSWHYLQPALYQCEVTYEARLKEHFGIGEPLFEDSEFSEDETETDDLEEPQNPCRHGLNTTLCEECGDRIAIEDVTFEGTMRASFLSETGTAHVTALHWACTKGPDGVSVGLKAIRAASVHQPSYIDGKDLLLRRMEYWTLEYYIHLSTINWMPAEIPPPLFLAVAFGNAELCEALIQAGCNVNLLQPGEHCESSDSYYHADGPFQTRILFKIHEGCTMQDWCEWHDGRFDLCRTAGYVAVSHDQPAMLKLLIDAGLDPHLGGRSLIRMAVHMRSRSVMMLLLDRYPEFSQSQDNSTNEGTPLHTLAGNGTWWKPTSVKLIKGIASDLIKKGGNLEEINHPSWCRWPQQGTPLQHALQTAKAFEYEEGYHLCAAEAFIQLGSVWNLPLRPSRPFESIFDYCISRATLCRWRGYYPRSDLEDKRFSRQRMNFARLVKVIIEAEGGRVNLASPPRKLFLDAFNELATRSIPLPTLYDAFATEVVGKLLLSTGITPDASIVSKWTQSMRKIQGWTAQSPSGRERSLWEDIMSDRPGSQHGRPGSQQGLEDTGTPELLGLFSGTYWC